MLTLTKLRQSGWIFKSSTTTIVLDAGNETTLSDLAVIDKLDAFVVSHQHADHFHPPNLLSRPSPLFAPQDTLDLIVDHPHPCITINDNTNFRIGDFTLSPFIVDHGDISKPITNFGFLVVINSITILFLGDIARPSQVPTRNYDVILVPVGGGKVFDAATAKTFTLPIAGNAMIVPMHYDGKSSRLNAEDFVALVGHSCHARILATGESIEL